MSDDEKPPEDGEKDNVFKLIQGEKKDEINGVRDQNQWFRNELAGMLANPNINFEYAVLVVGKENRVLHTYGLGNAVAILTWAQQRVTSMITHWG